MHAAHKQLLEKQFVAGKWRGRSKYGKRAIKDFEFKGSEIAGWSLYKVHRVEGAKPPVIYSLWQHGDPASELLAINVYECASVNAAHDQLFEVLGNVQSAAVEQRSEKNAPGDIAMGLANTMIVFARANIVMFIRNAGTTVVPVGTIARKLDELLMRWLEPGRAR
jgi:hypothetical protein